MDQDSIFNGYKYQLREILELWEVSPQTIAEIVSEIESHIAEGRRENRDLADILSGLGPVDQLAEAYGLALVLGRSDKSEMSKSQRFRSSVGNNLWLASLLLMFSIMGVIGAAMLIAGVGGAAASLILPFLSVEVLEPTLRAGIPQLVLFVLSILAGILGWQCLRWLRVNVRMARTAMWRNRKMKAGMRPRANHSNGDNSENTSNSESTNKTNKSVKLRVVENNCSNHSKDVFSILVMGLLITHAILKIGSAEANERVLESVIPIEEQSELQLIMGNGAATVEPSADSNIYIHLEVEPKRYTDDGDNWSPLNWFLTSRLDDDNSLMQAINVRVTIRDDVVIVRLTPRGRSRESRIKESWTVQVPADIHVKMSALAADIEISGIGAGVEIDQGYGDVTIDVPAGDLDVDLEVGNIRSVSGARDWRQISLETTVGNARAWVDNRKMDFPSPPGPGNSIRIEGRGEDTIKLKVGVGDAEIRFK